MRRLGAALQEIRSLRDRVSYLNRALENSEAKVRELSHYTLRIGVEKGHFQDPMYGLNLRFHPREFLYSCRGHFAVNVHESARRLAYDAADKIEKVLVEFCEKEGFR